MGKLGIRIARGTIWLSAGQLTSMLIAFTGSIIIARLIGPQGYGIVTAAQLLPLLVLGFFDLGIPAAITRYAALSKQQHATLAYMLRITLGILAGITTFLLSEPIARLEKKPELITPIKILSAYIIGIAIISATEALLQGKNRYREVAILENLRQAVRVTITITLVLIGLGAYGVIWGLTLSAIIIATIALRVAKKYISKITITLSRNELREIMIYSLPLSLPGLLGVPLNKAINIYMLRHVDLFSYGNFSIATNLSVVLNLLITALGAAIFSSLPLIQDADKKRIEETLEKSILYSSIIAIPLTVILITLSKPIVVFLYGAQYSKAPLYLSLIATNGFLVALGSTTINSFFNAFGYTKLTFQTTIIHTLIYVPLAFPLISLYKIIGYIVSLRTADVIATFYSIYIARQKLKIKIKIRKSLVLASLSLIAMPFALLVYRLPSAFLQILLGVSILLILYMLIIANVLKKEEKNELYQIIIEISPKRIRKILIKIINIIDNISILYNKS